MKTLAMALVALTVAVSGSSCLSSRNLKTVIQAAEKNATLVQTMDTYSFIIWPIKIRHQFWKCNEVPGMITCEKACSTQGSDLTCPDFIVGQGSTDH